LSEHATPDDGRKGTLGVLLVALAAVLWGTVGPAEVLGAGSVGPGALAGWRHLIAGLVLTVAAAPRLPALRRTGGRWWVWTVAAGVTSAAYQVAFLTSIALSGAAIGTMAGVAAVPLFTALGARLVTRERAGRVWMTGSGIAIAGCALLLLPGAGGGSGASVAGVWWGVAAGALFAAYTFCAQRLARSDVSLSTGVSMLVGAVLLSPLLVAGLPQLTDPYDLLLIAWLGVAATAVAYLLYGRGLRHVAAATAGALCLLEPASAAVLSLVVLGEQLTVLEWLGCGVILAGLVLTTAGPRERRENRVVPVVVEAPATTS
jgi:drug/metabolite transporter, DME family